VLTNYTEAALINGDQAWMFDVINGMSISYNDVISSMSFMQATKIIVEEFIGTDLPTEYKFHVIDGTVAAIDIIADRGGGCPCYAVIDTEGHRLDEFGCFEPGGYLFDQADNCTVIDFTTGKKKCGPVKKDLYLCTEVPPIPRCLLNDMIQTAIDIQNAIGVYMRIDMFVANNQYYVQEYTPNHMNGLRHCAAKKVDGCIDSCFLGRMYSGAGSPYGGVKTTVPAVLNGYLGLTPAAQCALITSVTPPVASNTC